MYVRLLCKYGHKKREIGDLLCGLAWRGQERSWLGGGVFFVVRREIWLHYTTCISVRV